jgi:outer membrane protein TolC
MLTLTNTTGLRNAKVWLAALAVVMMAAAPTAQQPQGGPSAPAQAPQIDKYVVGEAKPPDIPGSPLLDLTLERAIQIALEKNLDLQVARINPLIQDFSLKASRAAFLPSFNSSFRENHSQTPVANVLDGATTFNISNAQTYSGGMNQSMPWYGGNLSLSFTSGRTASNNANSTRNPSFSTGLSANYTQPLLAGFKMDNPRNTIRTATIQRQITDITLQNSIENTKASVRTAYWALRQAIESIEIQKRSLELAQRQFAESQQKVEIGVMAPIDTTNFDSAVASAEAALLNANITWRTQELVFKRLLVSGADDDLYKATINPVDKPIFATTSVDITAAIQNALAQRTDLESSRKNIQISQMTLDVTRSSTLPNLSLTGGYSLSGLGGPTLSKGVVTAPGGYFDALSSLGSLQTPTWNIGLSFTYPLGMVAAKATLAQRELTLDQTKAQLKALELTVTSDVTQAGLAVNNSFLQLQATKKSREAAEKNADAAQTRFTAGLANPFEVATALQALTNARVNELSAIIRYLNAIADFDKKQRVGG